MIGIIKKVHNKVYSAYPSGYAPYTNRYVQLRNKHLSRNICILKLENIYKINLKSIDMAKLGNYPLSNIQLELLQLFSRDLEERDILEIKQLIVNYLSNKLNRQTDKAWDEKKLTNDDMDKLLNTHLRTPYKD